MMHYNLNKQITIEDDLRNSKARLREFIEVSYCHYMNIVYPSIMTVYNRCYSLKMNWKSFRKLLLLRHEELFITRHNRAYDCKVLHTFEKKLVHFRIYL